MNHISDIGELDGIAEVKHWAKVCTAAELMELLYHPEPQVARNAAWVLTHKSDAELATLPTDRLIDLAMQTANTPLRRLVLNLVERQPIAAADMRTDFLDFCLAHMVMLEEPVGVQALCMKLACRMCSFYPELQEEFLATLRLVPVEAYKPGVAHLIKKYTTNNN